MGPLGCGIDIGLGTCWPSIGFVGIGDFPLGFPLPGRPIYFDIRIAYSFHVDGLGRDTGGFPRAVFGDKKITRPAGIKNRKRIVVEKRSEEQTSELQSSGRLV